MDKHKMGSSTVRVGHSRFNQEEGSLLLLLLVWFLMMPSTQAEPRDVKTVDGGKATLQRVIRIEDGVGCSTDLNLAKRLYQKSYEEGSSEAAWRLSCLYFGISKHNNSNAEKQGLIWCQKAAERGNLEAQYLMGERYFEGKSVPVSKEKSFKLFLAAAKQGKTEAYVRIADMCRLGVGTSIDYKKAELYYQIAASKGHTESMRLLSHLYTKGLAGKPDLAKAKFWHSRWRSYNNHEQAEAASVIQSLGR